ncbi:MAG TPA: NTP transferase domain-containing protein [Candidatus Methanoperedenaceae archaeon]|nr:NTP transferase domain-containing protein [Candidatus Methanoperedenaceae archaeon]
MKAVILAAGEGTRMRPLTATRPKVMLPVAGKPIIEHIMLAARGAGISDFVLVVGYKEDTVRNYFGDGSGWNINIEYARQEKQMGTADAVACARGLAGNRFFVLNGDIIIGTEDIRAMASMDADVVLAAKEVSNPKDFGVLEISDGKILRIIEKPENPPGNLVNAGVYLFTGKIFDAIADTPLSGRGEYEITTSLQLLLDRGASSGCHVLRDTWVDIGRPWDLIDANELMLSHYNVEVYGEVEPFATLKGTVSVGEGTIIRNGAYIVGPVIIGKNCDIGPNCYIRAGTSIGDDVRVGNAVEIKNSIIMSRTHIGHLAYVGDSVIGENCNFGAGTKVANLRHDGRTIRVMVRGEPVDSGRRKLGTIMGDDVHTGINSMLNVGSTVECGSHIAPGELVSGNRRKI